MKHYTRIIAAASLSAAAAFAAVPAAAFAEALPAETEEAADDSAETEDLEDVFSDTEEVPETELAGVTSDEAPGAVDPESVTYTALDIPFYFGDLDTKWELPVYFVNDVTDLPFMNLYDWIDIMDGLYDNDSGAYEITLETDGPVALLKRENGFCMIVDFDESQILFDDYDGFTQSTQDYSLLDTVSDRFVDKDGNTILLDRVNKGSFDRYGKEITLDLADYQIPLYYNADEMVYLIPLQTLVDFLISPIYGSCFLFNGEAVYCGSDVAFGFDTGVYTPFAEAYYSVEVPELSEELAWYSYCELCLALDNLYGLKEIHDISSFDEVFKETGYKHDLLSTDPNVKDGALLDFISYYLDDLHSNFCAVSSHTTNAETIGGNGLSGLQDSETGEFYAAAREGADHTIPAYEEVGNTAYVTFDHFAINKDPADYYSGETDFENDPDKADTAALILYAHQQITREDSPIENVVIDLSFNGGGQIDAGALVSAWFLEEASVSIRSSFTGAISTGTYRFDANLDGVFDEKDSVKDKNLYCLIGPYSFSCGNLVPNIFKSSGRVTLIGKQSGGGSCAVLSLSTAYGAMFNISSPRRMSYVKNGSYYDTDTGIEPDCVIVKPENFYDREALTEYINGLF